MAHGAVRQFHASTKGQLNRLATADDETAPAQTPAMKKRQIQRSRSRSVPASVST
jgi:hypothetical protein